MVIRARSVALLAVAASPLAAHASLNVLPAVQFPSFDCYSSAAGGNLSYAGGELFEPLLGLGSSTDKADVAYNPLTCSDKQFVESFANAGDSDYFTVKFSDKATDFTVKLDSVDFKFATFESFIFTKDDVAPSFKYFSLWDVTLDLFKYDNNTGAFLGEDKAFIGIQVGSDFKFVDGASFKIDDNALLFDPLIPDPNAEVSLYNTPAITPEPGSLVLLGTGLLGIGSAMRKRLGW